MERPKSIKAVLFDCDGVLLDSEPFAALSNMEVFKHLGLSDITYEDTIALTGKSPKHVVEVGKKYGINFSVKDFEDMRIKLRSDGTLPPTVYLTPEMQLMDGAFDTLVRLRKSGIKCGLVTTSKAAHILIMLNRFGLTNAFDVIITGDMVKHYKPDPEPYASAMEALGIAPENCVVIDDSPTGIASGVAAGAYVAAFCGSEVKQDTSAAHECFNSFAEFDLV